MNVKPRANHQRYLEVLRNMSEEQRLVKAFEMSAFTKQLFVAGLWERFPNCTEEELHQLMLRRLEKCHNRNY